MTAMRKSIWALWATRANAGWDWVARHFSPPGLLLASILFALSLTPSLLPRTELVQGVLSGCSFAMGYGIGNLGHWSWGFLGLRVPPGRITRLLGYLIALACLLLVGVALGNANLWQNSVRAVMGMQPVATNQPLLIAVVALPIALLLMLAGKLLVMLFRFIWGKLPLYVPRRAAMVLSALLVALLVAVVVNNVVWRGALRLADRFYGQLDAVVSDQDGAPTRQSQSGSAASLIPWDTIGRDARIYVQSGPDAAAITAMTGKPAIEPLRTYVGLRSAETVADRAALALAELQRIGAFERSVLVLVMPVGTGWVDRAGIDTLEYLHGGDVATVAVQYSYLTSWLSLLVEPDYGSETAQALFQAVYAHWTAMPRDDRPRLYLYGLSLGALASQASTQLYDILGDPFDGALWVGPPFSSPIWQWATANRQPGTPAWLPRFGNGTAIRFLNQSGTGQWPDIPWGPMRTLFLQYASDPIVFFDPNADWQRPAWLVAPRGPDVSPALNWYPVVTLLQLAVDMALAQTSPIGYGHVYAPRDYVDAWVEVTQPPGWSHAELDALKRAIPADEYLP